jgi:hypothetical protein
VILKRSIASIFRVLEGLGLLESFQDSRDGGGVWALMYGCCESSGRGLEMYLSDLQEVHTTKRNDPALTPRDPWTRAVTKFCVGITKAIGRFRETWDDIEC